MAIALASVLFVLAGTAGASSAASPLRWSAPRLVDHVPPFGRTSALNGVSCPSTSLCVAVGENVFASRNPAGGAGTWSRTAVGVGGAAVSCRQPRCALRSGRIGPHVDRSDWERLGVELRSDRRAERVDQRVVPVDIAVRGGGQRRQRADVEQPTGRSADMDLRAAGGPDLVHAIPACHARRVRVGAVVRRRRQQRTGVHLDRSGWRSLRVDFGARRSVERPDRDLLPIRLAVRCRRRRRKHRDIDRPHRWGWRLAARRLRWGQRPHGSHRDFMCLRNAVRRGRPQRQRVQFHQPRGGVSAWTDPVAADISGECAIRFCGPPVSSRIGLVPRADPALACPSTSLCALVDRFGAVVTTSDPPAGRVTGRGLRSDL